MAIAPNHPDIDRWITDAEIVAQVAQLRTGGWMRSDRGGDEVIAVYTGRDVAVPGISHLLPVLVSSYVESQFGACAILGIPVDDPLAEAIARDLRPGWQAVSRIASRHATERPAIRFAAGDYPISRQRAWGAPIPIVHCSGCGIVAERYEALPIELPSHLAIDGSGNPLAADASFINCECPRCGQPAQRDTDTLECHFDALWWWLPSCVPASERPRSMFDHPEVRRWIPADRIVWGMDGGALIHSQRVVTKMLRDSSVFTDLADGEPFVGATMHGMVESDGRKMSKHLGNVVAPDELVDRFGADAVRLAAMRAAAPRHAMRWDEDEVSSCHRFLVRLWRFVHARLDVWSGGQDVGVIDRSDRLRSRLARWCDVAVAKITAELDELQPHRAARNVMRMLTRIEDFDASVMAKRNRVAGPDAEALACALSLLLRLAEPLTPHIAEELWCKSGHTTPLCETAWPADPGSRDSEVQAAGGGNFHDALVGGAQAKDDTNGRASCAPQRPARTSALSDASD